MRPTVTSDSAYSPTFEDDHISHLKPSKDSRSRATPIRPLKLANKSCKNPLHVSQSSIDSSPQSPDSSSRIRSRYLYRLGVSSTPKERMTIPCCDSTVPSSSQSGSSSTAESAAFEVLKSDYGKSDQDITAESPPQKPMKEQPKVSFQSAVTVHAIPHHKAYSDRVRRTVWMDRSEMEETMLRNSLEFQSENWDWQQAVEEDEMFLVEYSSPDSQPTQHYYVHPVHYHIQQQFSPPRCSLQNQFLKVMCAQRVGC